MIHTRIRPVFFTLLLAGAILAATPAIQAQTSRPGQPDRPGAPAQPTFIDNSSADDVRRELYGVLNQYPPTLGRVLRLDPTLLQNQDYLTNYPQLAAYLAQHPQIAHNPGFFLDRYSATIANEAPLDPQREAVRMWREIIDFMGAFLVFIAIASGVIYLIKYLVEYRRWHRVTKVQTEVHNKILDRFASNEDLLAYIQTPAGRRFLESSPVVVDSGPKSVGAPFSRILWSVQVGVIVTVAAIGLMIVSGRSVPEVSGALFAVATIGMAIGIGFVLSAAVAYILSRRMGLIEPPATPPAPHAQSPL